MLHARAVRTLPTLDLSDLERSARSRAALLQDLRAAAREFGFFYLVGHGVHLGLIESVQSLSRRFFALPETDKLATEMINSPHFRGYNRAGFEHTRGKPDWREQVDIGSERPALDPSAIKHPWQRLQGPNLWPSALPELRPTLLAYLDQVTALAIHILRAFSAALEQPEDVFAPIYSPAPWARTKIRASPPSCCRKKPLASRSRGRTGGSTRHPKRDHSLSMSVRSSRSPPTATCAPTCTGWCRRQRVRIVSPWHSSLAPGSTPKFRF